MNNGRKRIAIARSIKTIKKQNDSNKSINISKKITNIKGITTVKERNFDMETGKNV